MKKIAVFMVGAIVHFWFGSFAYAEYSPPKAILALKKDHEMRANTSRQQSIVELRSSTFPHTLEQDSQELEGLRLVLLGKMLLANRQYREAEQVFLKADQNEKNQTGHHSAAILTNLTRLYMEQNIWEKAEKNLLLQLQAYRREKAEDSFEIRYTKARLAETYLAQHKFLLASETAYSSVYEKDLRQATAEDLLLLGQVEQALRNYPKAETHLKKAMAILEKQKYKSFIDEQTRVKILQQIADLYTIQGLKSQADIAQQHATTAAKRLDREFFLQDICLIATNLKENNRLEEAKLSMQFCVDEATELYGADSNFTQTYLETLRSLVAP
ncbi:MAG: hypothetical protein Q4G39_06190 [Brachymonas sp.]|nr:hypothetical protein [Brachymonas sp.]